MTTAQTCAMVGLPVEPSDSKEYSFSYTTYSYSHALDEIPTVSQGKSEETIPLDAFAHASTMQVVARYLVDIRKLSFTDAAKMLGRNVKSIWTSYHQTKELPALKESLQIPVSIFTGKQAPLESLVFYLKSKGLRNVEIASVLKLDPKTTWTAAKRAEAKQ